MVDNNVLSQCGKFYLKCGFTRGILSKGILFVGLYRGLCLKDFLPFFFRRPPSLFHVDLMIDSRSVDEKKPA